MEEPIKADAYERLLSFLSRLEASRIHYALAHSRDEAIMILIDVPGERWEVEFMQDGTVEIERFISTGEIENESILDDFFKKYSD